MPPTVRPAPDSTPVTYAHPPLVESWLEVTFVQSLPLSESDLLSLRTALGPEWSENSNRVDAERPWTNLMGDRALRLMAHTFAFGWLGYTGERYPRYESVRDGFVTVLDALRTLADQQGKILTSNQWSVRYVNRIPRGTVWNSAGDWEFFSLWRSDALKGLAINPDGFSGKWDFQLEDDQGNLAIDFLHVTPDSPEELDNVVIRLTARGPIRSTESGLFDGLDYGRDVIVRSFNELVSAEAKAYWGVGVR